MSGNIKSIIYSKGNDTPIKCTDSILDIVYQVNNHQKELLKINVPDISEKPIFLNRDLIVFIEDVRGGEE